ncbi:hypothetical protein GCM10023196_033160 [Actinoallomurus vinaceus]|uniref:DUF397 domain-containing protein n=1 Tax=Actinoallomurus vinaceus TaxID=1080074 RepID=A0ABP8U8E4_9ACTN
MIDLSQAIWRKASASTGSNGACVEVATNLPPGSAAMRDSTRPSGATHMATSAALRVLLDDVRAGAYDV